MQFKRLNSMTNLAQTFHSLHKEKDILVLPNAWDAGSAKVIEDAGAKAIATSSAGVAWALGYPDGDVLPPRMLTDLTARITNVIRIPLSVDFEGGYTKNPAKVAENLKPIIDAGAVGINIEDGEDSPELLAKKIEKARKAAESAGVNLFINARTDVYLAEIGSPESRVGRVTVTLEPMEFLFQVCLSTRILKPSCRKSKCQSTSWRIQVSRLQRN